MNEGRVLDEFIAYIAYEKGLALNTQKSYRHDIEKACQYCKEKEKPWPITYEALVSYMDHMRKENLKETTQVRSLVAIKMFLQFLYREEKISENEALLIESPKIWKTIPSIISYEEMEKILSLPDLRTDFGILSKAILEMLYGTGMRVSELCHLSIYDVTDDMIRIIGKGSKERLVPIGKKALEAVDSYLHAVRSKFDSTKNLSLFVNSRGSSLDRGFVWKMVKEYAKKAQIQASISPHSFRHTYASHLLDAGADIRIIQELLGHAHISSTDRYTQVSCNHIQDLFKSCHPRWRS